MLKKITRASLRTFLTRHTTSEQVLDVGSGGSSYGDLFPHRLTVDIDPARKPEVIADAHNLPFESESFQVILCTEVLEHLADPRKGIGEMWRVLKPGGKLILTTRFVYPLHDVPGDYWRFTKYGMRALFSEWHIEELVEETPTFSAIGVLLQRVAFQSKLRGGVFTKAILFMLAALCTRLNWLIVKEYGDIKKSTEEEHIISSGYYIVCHKK